MDEISRFLEVVAAVAAQFHRTPINYFHCGNSLPHRRMMMFWRSPCGSPSVRQPFCVGHLTSGYVVQSARWKSAKMSCFHVMGLLELLGCYSPPQPQLKLWTNGFWMIIQLNGEEFLIDEWEINGSKVGQQPKHRKAHRHLPVNYSRSHTIEGYLSIR